MQTIETQENKGLLGFTLIELSIVLVIIGLIVGGVLVGQDLIKAAEIRATVSQYEKYNATVNTFRTKYNGIPGDLAAASCTAFGLNPAGGAACMAGTAGLGDGNGLVQDTGSSSITAVGEPLAFWQQMSAANLIDGNYGSSLLATGLPTAGTSNTNALIGNYLPPAKVGRGNYWAAAADSGINYYMLSGFGAVPVSDAGVITFNEALTPIESFNIDVKVDDGAPNTGTVQARGDGTAATGALYASLSSINAASYNASPVAGTCMTTGGAAVSTTNTYARGTASGNSPACLLRMRFN